MKKITLILSLIATSVFSQPVLTGAQGGTGFANRGKILKIGDTLQSIGASYTHKLIFPLASYNYLYPAYSNTVATISGTEQFTNKIISTGNNLGTVTMLLGGDGNGDMYYRNGSNLLTRIPTGTTNQILSIVSPNTPGWITAPASTFTINSTAMTTGMAYTITANTTNPLTVDNSSIQLNSGTTFDGSAARTISVKTSGITNAMLAGSIDLTTKVTGILPTANGGTGQNSTATFPTSGIVVTEAGTETLSNKTILTRTATVVSSATITVNADATDLYTISSLSVATTFTVPTGTPTEGQGFGVRLKDNGTARGLTFTTGSAGSFNFPTTLPAPTTTTLGKYMYLWFVYNAGNSRWDCLSIIDGF